MKARLLVVGAAVAAALLVWLVAEVLVGTDLQGPGSGGEPMDVTAVHVLATSLLAGLAGWGALALLERLTSRGRLVWTVLASAVAVLSLLGPLGGSGVSSASRAWLVVLHVVVAAIIIPGLPRASSLPRVGERTPSPAGG